MSPKRKFLALVERVKVIELTIRTEVLARKSRTLELEKPRFRSTCTCISFLF